jgi:L-glyceraldehyde 3-phosphate reductase
MTNSTNITPSEAYTPALTRYDGGMPYRRCGRSGLLMSELSLGFWHNFGGVDDYANARAMAHAAFDHGITCFDLANNYGPPYGSAEETFGRLMRDSFGPLRDELFITTKAGYDMWPGPYGNWGSRKYLMASLDQSLRRMHLDYVDLFYTHRYDPETPLEETLQALVDVVRAGKALYVGISRYPAEAARFAYDYLRRRDVPCLCYQGKFNLLYQGDGAPGGILEEAASAGVGYVGFSPLQQGLLTNRYLHGIPEGSRMTHSRHLTADVLTPELVARLQRLDAIARGRGQSLADMALAWVLQRREVTSVIVGTSSVGQLMDNLRVVESAPFTPDELSAIAEALA